MKLSIAVGERPHLRPLLAGEVPLAGYELGANAPGPIIGAYRRMVRELAYDVCELAPVTYLMAIRAGIPLTGIPVFLDRRFHHGDLRCSPASGITVPRDLEGRRVGVRAYSVTTGVWVRGMLAADHGVDLDRITWVVDDEDHLPFPGRPHIERVADGTSLRELLHQSRIDAAFGGNAGTGRVGGPRNGWEAPAASRVGEGAGEPYPLFMDAGAAAYDWYQRTGVYPLHAVVTVRAELVERDPELPTLLYRAFAESKRLHLAQDPSWGSAFHLQRQGQLLATDPLPYGERPNAMTLGALEAYAVDQGLIAPRLATPGGWFAPGEYPPA